jgi:5-methyltetrahydrofolate--homocysteine methyltransferase
VFSFFATKMTYFYFVTPSPQNSFILPVLIIQKGEKKMERYFFDGGMGTVLYKKRLTEDPVRLNLTHGEEIADIHTQYLTAGATVLTANTFGAYTHKHGDAQDLIKAAMRHAKKAIDTFSPKEKNYLVALDMGPLGLMLEPFGDTTFDEAYGYFSAAAQTGAENGADLILIETFYCINELEAAVKAAKETGLPVFATMTFDVKGRSTMGVPIAKMVNELAEWGVNAVGMNCGLGPDVYKELLPVLLAAAPAELPLLVQPNAGLPEIVNGQTVYNVTPADFAAKMAEMDALATGRILHLGGCCGTAPEHIKALIAACGTQKK